MSTFDGIVFSDMCVSKSDGWTSGNMSVCLE